DSLTNNYKNSIKIECLEEVLEQAGQAPESVYEADLVGRRDLRDETIVTIDGADAKDLDDAISVKKLDNGHYKLGVYISDVTYYVEKNTPMDLEAHERGTSVYF